MQNIDLSFFPSKVRFSTAVTESAREPGTREKSVNVGHPTTTTPNYQDFKVKSLSHILLLYIKCKRQ